MIIQFKINGKERKIEVKDDEMLLDTIREKLHLYGTKRGCENGECGACTVLVDNIAVNSCIFPSIRANGKEITTIEGLATPEKLHSLQKAFIKEGALQCGFCGSGILMTAKALLLRNPNPSVEEIKEELAGHLCRCSGYEKIIKGIDSAAREIREAKDVIL